MSRLSPPALIRYESVLMSYREIVKYLNQEEVQAVLGVKVTEYNSCSDAVGYNFALTLDIMKGATGYVSALLERGVPVLIYVGTYDWVCNWVGNQAWTLALEWSGQAEFASQPLREWTVDGKRAGKTRSAKGFTFATVDGAGHMVRRWMLFATHFVERALPDTHFSQVPYDKPKQSLEMVNRWITGQPL